MFPQWKAPRCCDSALPSAPSFCRRESKLLVAQGSGVTEIYPGDAGACLAVPDPPEPPSWSPVPSQPETSHRSDLSPLPGGEDGGGGRGRVDRS